MHYRLNTFSASEAERVSGLSQNMQRDWRKRGFLPPVEGKARFDFFDIAVLKVMKLLADRGMGPKAGGSIAWPVAYGIASRALRFAESWEGFGTQQPAEWSTWYKETLDACLRKYWTSSLPAGVVMEMPATFRAIVGFGMEADFVIFSADGAATFASSLDEHFGKMTMGTDGGPYIIFDLQIMAPALARELGPFARIVIDGQ
jgi:hypothetical protein